MGVIMTGTVQGVWLSPKVLTRIPGEPLRESIFAILVCCLTSVRRIYCITLIWVTCTATLRPILSTRLCDRHLWVHPVPTRRVRMTWLNRCPMPPRARPARDTCTRPSITPHRIRTIHLFLTHRRDHPLRALWPRSNPERGNYTNRFIWPSPCLRLTRNMPTVKGCRRV